jgi:outer membrane protein OmpA-like peptidoglycan-associated protein
MYQEDNDDTTRAGLWITFAVVTLLIISVISSVVVRQLRGVTAATAAPAAVATATTATTTVVEEIVLIEGPVAGDLAGTVYFESGQSALPAGATAEIDKAVQALKAAPGRKLVLSGFHDATGDAAVNAELAKQRAVSARAAVQAAGIEATRIALRKPEVMTGTGTEQEARRVELRIVD